MVDTFSITNDGNNTRAKHQSNIISDNNKMNIDKPDAGSSQSSSSSIISSSSEDNDSKHNHDNDKISYDTTKLSVHDINMIIMGGPSKHDAESIIISKDNSNEGIAITKNVTRKGLVQSPLEEEFYEPVDKEDKLLLDPDPDVQIIESTSSSSNDRIINSTSSSNEANFKINNISDSILKHKLKLNNNNNQKQLNNLDVRLNNSSSYKNNNNISTNKNAPKSILENCLTRSGSTSSSSSTSSLESQHNNNMDDNHKHSSAASSSTAVGGGTSELVENRKVEPLKINLHRDQIRTVIKLPASQQDQQPHSPKITIKPIKPPHEVESIPKLTIKPIINPFASDLSSSETIEPHIVPKLTIRGVGGATQQLTVNHHNSSGNSHTNDTMPTIVPKLTIKKDNHASGHHHLHNNRSDKDEGLVVPKIHIKAIQKPQDQSILTSEGVKLTIKPIPEPPLPKLTIKTNALDSTDVAVVSSTSSDQQSITATVPKLTIKPIPKPSSEATLSLVIPKLTIKPIVKPFEDSCSSETSMNSVESSPTSSSSATVSPSVPKLMIKVPKENDTTAVSQTSLAITPIPVVHKLNIKPIVHPESLTSSTNQQSPTLTSPILIIKKLPHPQSQNESESIVIPKVTIKTVITPKDGCKVDELKTETLSTPKVTLKPIPKPVEHQLSQPLEIVTSTKCAESGQDSPRIILKINKGSSTTSSSGNKDILTSNETPKKSAQQSQSVISNRDDNKMQHAQKSVVNDLKRPSEATKVTDNVDVSESKKPKLTNHNVDMVTSNSKTQENNDDAVQLRPKNVVETSKEESKKPASTPSRVQESGTNLKEILTRMTRHKRQQEQINMRLESNKHKLMKAALMEADGDSSSDCMIIEEPMIVLEKIDKNGTSDACGNIEMTKMESNEIVAEAEEEKTEGKVADKDSGLEDVKHDFDTIIDTHMVQSQTKRGRGRPKKIVRAKASHDLEEEEDDEKNEPSSPKNKESTPTSVDEDEDDSNTNDSKGASKLRGRGRGRGKKFIEIVKDGKTQIVKLDDAYDDDNSPTFSIYNRYGRGRGRGRGRGARRARGGKFRGGANSINNTPEKSRNFHAFMTPDGKDSSHRRKQFMRETSTPSLQVFEEDTRMSGDFNFQTPMRHYNDYYNNDESQSSYMSSTSVTQEGSYSARKSKGKMEVGDINGRTEFAIEMLAEYEWPPPSTSSRHNDTFMIQEQIAEYLGVKSFKRKYPDLMRRPVEMEERNFIMERGMASEKMCDLGLTAVYASEVLDIMCNDYPEKYEEYKRYHREKHFREMSFRQKFLKNEVSSDRSQLQKDKAIRSAASWNSSFNKDRTENRRACMDLQNLVVQVPKTTREKMSRPVSTTSNYPVALVPGQFSEYYTSYTPAELACYPINTCLLDPVKLEEILTTDKYRKMLHDEDSGSGSSSSSSSSSSGSDSSSSSDDDSDSSSDSSDKSDASLSSNKKDSRVDKVRKRRMCQVCLQSQHKNQNNKPERFIRCNSCKRQAHPSCIDMSVKMLKRAMEYNWQCSECKTCSKCRSSKNENKMLFCDQCDRGYHIYCIGLRNVPDGRWHCSVCSICKNCGTRNPEGHPNPNLTQQQKQNLAMIAHWTHEYKTNDASKIREHYSTLCVPCARQKTL